MCGIFCYFTASSASTSQETLQEKASCLAHRGPDENKEYKDEHVYMNFHRLAINGLDSRSGQPMQREDCVLVANAEIYNHVELTKRYELERLNESDCEVIPLIVHRFGLENALNLFLGVFAFVLWDRKERKLYVARDPIGIRPLFYGKRKELYLKEKENGELKDYKDGEGESCQKREECEIDEYIFASEMKAFPDDFEIQVFPPGSYFVYDLNDKSTTLCSYYDVSQKLVPERLSLRLNSRNIKSDSVLETLKNLAIDAIRIRCCNTQRRVGVFLSGGLDSTIAATIAKRFIPNLESFCIGFEKDSSDLIAARNAARELGLKHHEVIFTFEEAMEAMEELVYHLETPDVTTIRASMGMFLLSRYIKRNTDITVVISAEGCDELFSGYLYNFYRPSLEALHEEAVKRMRELHLYDVLRCDRSTAAASLEVRVPFLDRDLVNFVLGLDPELRDPITNGIEKALLRKAFKDEGVPFASLQRRKEAFSDGVGHSWVDKILEFTKSLDMEEAEKYVVNKPKTKEALYYRKIYDKLFSKVLIEDMWMPNWTKENNNDPSARKLKIY